MKPTKIVLISALAVATACGGGKKSDNTIPPPPPTPITTPGQAESASAASTQSLEIALDSLSYIGGLSGGITPAPRFKSSASRDPRFAALRAAQAKTLAAPKARLADGLRRARSLAASRASVIIDETYYCGDSGTVAFHGTADDTTYSATLTVTFDACREYDQETNGSVVESFSANALDTSESFSVRYGDGDGTLEATDFTVTDYTIGYGSVVGTETMDLTVSGTWRCTDDACNGEAGSFSANGKEQYEGADLQYVGTYSGLSVSGTDTYTDTSSHHTAAFNGTMTGSLTAGGITTGSAITYYGFALTEDDTAEYYEQTIDGTIKLDFTPDDACFEGTLSIDTQTPIRYTYLAGTTTAGRVVVNGKVTITYNADGSVTLTLTGETPVDYPDISALQGVCAI